MFFAAALIGLLVLAGLAVGREIIRNNYYVTAHDGTVSIMRGIRAPILGIRTAGSVPAGLPQRPQRAVAQISYGQALDNLDCRMMRLQDLRPSERAQVAAGLPGGSLDDAIGQLRELSRTSLLPPCPSAAEPTTSTPPPRHLRPTPAPAPPASPPRRATRTPPAEPELPGPGTRDHRRSCPAVTDGDCIAATTAEAGDRLPGGGMTTASRRTGPRHEARRGASA